MDEKTIEAIYKLIFICHFQNASLKILAKHCPEYSQHLEPFLRLNDELLSQVQHLVGLDKGFHYLYTRLEQKLNKGNLPDEVQQIIKDFLDSLKS